MIVDEIPRPALDPGQRDHGRTDLELGCDVPHGVDHLIVVLIRRAEQGGHPGPGAVGRRGTPAGVLAGQEAVLQRAPRQYAEAQGAGGRDQLGLGRPLQQRVLQLERGDRGPAAELGDGGGLGDLPGGQVGQADVPDLARGDQVVQGAQGFLDRGHRVVVVQPVQVHVVGLQPPQRVLQLLDDALAPGAAAVRVTGIQVAEELGPEHHPVPPVRVRAEVVPDDLFRVPAGVDVGRVDRVAAPVQVRGQDVGRLRRAGAPAVVVAEGHRAQRERAHPQARPAQGHVRIRWQVKLPVSR